MEAASRFATVCVPAPEAGGRIGPNAVTRVAEALLHRHGRAMQARVFNAAGLAHHLARPPDAMIPDRDVAELHRALRGELGLAEALEVGAEAGRLTAVYLLANRIPRVAQLALCAMPSRLALRLLLQAIGRHAWTFAGSGRFSFSLHEKSSEVAATLAIEGGPVSRLVKGDSPACSYYAATFETLFKAIISSRASVVETRCEAQGAESCLFAVSLR